MPSPHAPHLRRVVAHKVYRLGHFAIRFAPALGRLQHHQGRQRAALILHQVGDTAHQSYPCRDRCIAPGGEGCHRSSKGGIGMRRAGQIDLAQHLIRMRRVAGGVAARRLGKIVTSRQGGAHLNQRGVKRGLFVLAREIDQWQISETANAFILVNV